MPDDCIFCAISNRTASAEVVQADDHTLAFLDISPATRGHTLVIPRRHSANLLEIEPEDLERVAVMAQTVAKRMPDALGCDGVNLLNSCGMAAWQTVFHFHMHVIPRYEDDPLKLPWVPGAPADEDFAQIAHLLRR
jgi:histidine triad (HIT) family protein